VEVFDPASTRDQPASSESESELLYDWPFTANHFVLATSPLRPTISNFTFQMSTCRYSPYVTTPLTRGWTCRLQLLLVLDNAVILMSESRVGTDPQKTPFVLVSMGMCLRRPATSCLPRTCLRIRCLANDVSSDFTIPDFGRHVTISREPLDYTTSASFQIHHLSYHYSLV
jgi:hypothetical protein